MSKFISQRVQGLFAELLDAVLNLSRITRAEMNYEQVNLSKMAEEIAARLQKRAPERNVEFVIEEGLVASGDRQLLRVVLEGATFYFVFSDGP